MQLPELSYLQLLVIEAIAAGRVSGRKVREHLKQNGVPKGGPAFYQLMSRLEDSGFVEGNYEEKIIDGQRIKERFYRVTGEGERAVRQALNFFENRTFVFGQS